MDILCKFICKADVTLRPLAYAQLQKRYHHVIQHFVVSGSPPEFKSGMKLNGTNKGHTLYTTLHQKYKHRSVPSL